MTHQQTRLARCEEYELEISALIDGELPAVEALAVTDHMVHCPDCREFYRLVRGVDRALAEARVSAREGDLPAGLWSRIAASVQSQGTEPAGKVVALHPARRAIPPWVWKVAAAVLVVVGTWSLAGLWLSPAPSLEGGALQVHLESDRGAMTDERFIELTTELLRAHRRYHRKMLEIMTAVDSRSLVNEGSPEPRPLPVVPTESDYLTSQSGTGLSADEGDETW